MSQFSHSHFPLNHVNSAFTSTMVSPSNRSTQQMWADEELSALFTIKG